jgi:hypothetical protein
MHRDWPGGAKKSIKKDIIISLLGHGNIPLIGIICIILIISLISRFCVDLGILCHVWLKKGSHRDWQAATGQA